MTTWSEYVQRLQAGREQQELARAAGVSAPTVSRWVSGKSPAPAPQTAVSLARGTGGNPLEALIAAGFITPEEANARPLQRIDLTTVDADDLLDEIRRRLKGGEGSGDPATTTTPPPTDLASRRGQMDPDFTREDVAARRGRLTQPDQPGGDDPA